MNAEAELQRIIRFFGRELPREGGRHCVQLGLFTGPIGSHGQEIRTWYRVDDPRLFEDQSGYEQLANQVLDVAREHAAGNGPGQYRFELRTRQYLQGVARCGVMLQVDSWHDHLARFCSAARSVLVQASRRLTSPRRPSSPAPRETERAI